MKKWVIASLIFLVLLPSVLGAYTFNYYSGGYYGGTSSLLFGLYTEYSFFIDFIIFLLIFLGLTQAIFGTHFKSGSKPLSLGIALMLSFGLTLWESHSGFTLLDQ